jgi:hypothetical protein
VQLETLQHGIRLGLWKVIVGLDPFMKREPLTAAFFVALIFEAGCKLEKASLCAPLGTSKRIFKKIGLPWFPRAQEASNTDKLVNAEFVHRVSVEAREEEFVASMEYLPRTLAAHESLEQKAGDVVGMIIIDPPWTPAWPSMNGPFVMNIRPILLIVGSNVTFQYIRISICGY